MLLEVLEKTKAITNVELTTDDEFAYIVVTVPRDKYNAAVLLTNEEIKNSLEAWEDGFIAEQGIDQDTSDERL